MDILIKNARIIDGTGAPSYTGDVGVSDHKIVFGELPGEADLVIDASGKCVSPGFIDAHSHGDNILGKEYGDLCKINEGFTTQIAGMCGCSMAPVAEENLEGLKEFLSSGCVEFPEDLAKWKHWSDYLNYVESLPKALNTALFVGYNTVRIAVMGYDNRKPTERELERMKDMVRNAMEHGAIGMSSGLAYVPAAFDDTDTVAEVAKVLAPYNGIYTSHIRNESFDLAASVEEAIEIGRRAGIQVNISHIKAMGRSNWGNVSKALDVIEKARDEGLKVTCDQYPYNCSMTHYYPCMPPWYFADGLEKAAERLKDPDMRSKVRAEMESPDTGYENLYLNAGGWTGITICACDAVPEAEGLTFAEYAEKNGQDPFDAYFDIMIANKGKGPAVYHSIGDEDIYDIIRRPYVVVGSDGVVRTATEKCHPRGWGTAVRAICAFTKDKTVLSLEEIVHKMTGLTADIYSLKGKGKIADGMDADLVVFDYENLQDNADYRNPNALAGGIEYVITGGEVVYHDGKLTGAKPGKILLRGN